MILVHGKMGTVPLSFWLYGNHAPAAGEKRRWKNAELRTFRYTRDMRYHPAREPWQRCIIEQIGSNLLAAKI